MAEEERLKSYRKIKKASDKSFGFVFSAVFCVVGFYPLLGGGAVRWWSLALALAFLGLSLFAARWLAPLNKIWSQAGTGLQVVVNPVIMGLLFYAALVPMALLLKLGGKNLLRLNFEKEAKSYWISREPPGPEKGSFKQQF
ncbi:MAG: hypothetical protein HGA90_07790 [Alphaproteobacteria bacterium]|nr:hypothetical protein [Alphaproteobacteria bacterium]